MLRQVLSFRSASKLGRINGNIRYFSTSENNYPTFTIGLLPGDGIGKDVLPCAEKLIKAIPSNFVQANFQFLHLDAGFDTFQKTGKSLPQETLDNLKKCNSALVGSFAYPPEKTEGYINPLHEIRKSFDLYSNIKPILSSPLLNTKGGVDMVIIRDNSDSEIKETLEQNDSGVHLERSLTKKASLRVAEAAFKLAIKRKAERPEMYRKNMKVTVVLGGNAGPVSEDFFKRCCLEVSQKYPDVPMEIKSLDEMIAGFLTNPQKFDVILAMNSSGDILANAGFTVVGGPTIAPSSSVGDYFAIGEVVQEPSMDIAGKNLANPIGAIRSASLMLRNTLGFPTGQKTSELIDEITSFSLRHGPKTRDVTGKAHTNEVMDFILEELKLTISRIERNSKIQ